MMVVMMWERRLDPIGRFSTHSEVRLHLPIVNDFGDSARSQSPEFAARAARIFREAPEG